MILTCLVFASAQDIVWAPFGAKVARTVSYYQPPANGNHDLSSRISIGTSIDSTIGPLEPGVDYVIALEVLSNHLGWTDSLVKTASVNGFEVLSGGSCNPDGGKVCSFGNCPIRIDPNGNGMRTSKNLIRSSGTTAYLHVELSETHNCVCDTFDNCFSPIEDKPDDFMPLPISNLGGVIWTFTPYQKFSAMVFESGTDEGFGSYTTKFTFPLVVGLPYKIKFEILRNDLGGADEYVSDASVNGINILSGGRCNPTGLDHDCTFHECDLTSSTLIRSFSSKEVTLSISLVGHSKDCKCVISRDPHAWECVSEDTTKMGATDMVAVGRFTFEPYLSTTYSDADKYDELTSLLKSSVDLNHNLKEGRWTRIKQLLSSRRLAENE